MEKAGIICCYTSPWSSPLHMVYKKEGGWRPCGDYQRLNSVKIPDWYPLPNITDFTSRISGATVFSKLDLQKGYYQVPMASEDIQKTAIVTSFGMFKFLRMPFGLQNAETPFNSWGTLFWVSFLSVSSTWIISNLLQGPLLPNG